MTGGWRGGEEFVERNEGKESKRVPWAGRRYVQEERRGRKEGESQQKRWLLQMRGRCEDDKIQRRGQRKVLRKGRQEEKRKGKEAKEREGDSIIARKFYRKKSKVSKEDFLKWGCELLVRNVMKWIGKEKKDKERSRMERWKE
jgi:hypothetical protein